MKLFKLIKTDYLKYKKYGGNFFSIIFFTQGFWAIFQYRIAHYVYQSNLFLLTFFLKVLCFFWQKTIEIITGISIPSSVEIGNSFYVGHFGGIILNSKCKIGNNCNISQGVTIGVSGRGINRGVPIIMDNVYIGANSVVAGKIIVEDNSLIGANSLVVNDVEKGTTVLGVPAIKINNNSSEGYI